MHTPMHRKYAIAWRIGGAASREDRTSLLDCIDPCRGNMPLRRRMGCVASREEETSLLNCTRTPKGRMSAKLTGAWRASGRNNLPLLGCDNKKFYIDKTISK